MAASSDLADTIETIATTGAKRVDVDGQSVDFQELSALIEADRYLCSKAAAASPKRGLVITKLSPPGTV